MHLRADDGIRTRDPHLGKVMRYQLRYIRAQRTRSSPGAKHDDSPRDPAHTNLQVLWGALAITGRGSTFGAGTDRASLRPRCRSAPVPWLSGRASASHAEGRWFDPSRDHTYLPGAPLSSWVPARQGGPETPWIDSVAMTHSVCRIKGRLPDRRMLPIERTRRSLRFGRWGLLDDGRIHVARRRRSQS